MPSKLKQDKAKHLSKKNVLKRKPALTKLATHKIDEKSKTNESQSNTIKDMYL